MTARSQVRAGGGDEAGRDAVALGVRRVGVRTGPPESVSAGQSGLSTTADVLGSSWIAHNCNHNCNHADSGIVRWYAEHYCRGDVLLARRVIARWSAAEAARWLRVATIPKGTDNADGSA